MPSSPAKAKATSCTALAPAATWLSSPSPSPGPAPPRAAVASTTGLPKKRHRRRGGRRGRRSGPAHEVAREALCRLRVVSLLGHAVAQLSFRPSETVFAVKTRLCGLADITPYRQELVHAKVVLANSARMGDCGVTDGATVTLVKSRQPLALTCSFDRALRLWDVARGKCLETMLDNERAPMAAAADPTAKRVLVAYNGGCLRMLCLASGSILREYGKHGTAICCLTAGWGASQALTGSVDGSLALWDLQGSRLRTLRGHSAEVMAVVGVWIADAAHAASASSDASIRIWDLRRGCCLGVIKEAHAGAALALDVIVDASGAASRIASGGLEDCLLKVWDLSHDVGYSQDLLCPGQEVSARLSVREALTLPGHLGGVWSVVCDSWRQRVLSSSGDRTVRLWSILGAGATLAVFSGHESIVWSVAAAWDDGIVASVSHDGTMRLWSLGGALDDDKPCGDLAGKEHKLGDCLQILPVGGSSKAVVMF